LLATTATTSDRRANKAGIIEALINALMQGAIGVGDFTHTPLEVMLGDTTTPELDLALPLNTGHNHLKIIRLPCRHAVIRDPLHHLAHDGAVVLPSESVTAKEQKQEDRTIHLHGG
jgi:hypothetical protein